MKEGREGKSGREGGRKGESGDRQGKWMVEGGCQRTRVREGVRERQS